MGYDLHITRAERWTATEGREITSDEWLHLLHEDAELQPEPEFGPFAARIGPRRLNRWFDWAAGNIYTTSPDRRSLAKMLEIAGRLHARVQGDHGEWYDSPEQCPVE